MNFQHTLDEIYDNVKLVLSGKNDAKVASYIPELAKVAGNQFGMAIVDLKGNVYSIGDATVPFSIQSISKLFGLTQAMRLEGDSIWQRVGREPSGNPFNSLVQLEREGGKPRNPFINAGALVITDMLCTHFRESDHALLEFVQKLAHNKDIKINHAVAQSERGTSNRNLAMAYFMKNFGNLSNEVSHVLDIYCKHCAIEMSCIDLAHAITYLANEGNYPSTGESILDKTSTKRINALMLTCGTYDSAGDFAFRVGLPAKSGVGGGIVAIIPGECGICVWSPALEESGNSYAGSIALELLTTVTGRSIF